MAGNAKDSKILEYKDLISQLNTTIAAQTELIKSLQQSLEADRAEKKILQEKIDYLTKKLFGTSSEKCKDISGQLNLFDEAEQEADNNPEIPTTIVSEHKRKSKSTHQELFKGVPSRDEIISLPKEERNCAKCGTELQPIGKEFVRHEFRFTPAKGEVINIYRETYKCPTCSTASQMAENIKFVKAHVPEALIPNSYTSESAVAWVMYQKFVNATPLYRQEQDWKQLGVPFTRATLANWIIYCAKTYFEPMYEYLHRQLLARTYLMADETRIQVLKEPERNPETDSFMWLFRTGEDGLPPIILYHYTETRAKYNAASFLKGFSGYLETDGYQGYNNLPGVKRCSCWTHMRRYFIEAVPKGKEYDYSNPAVQGVQFCLKLFEYENISKNKKHSAEQRKAYRLEKEKPILDAFWSWIEQQKPQKGTRFEKAVNYALNRKDTLMTYLEDGHCSLSNNLSENSIRPFTVGRKNWLFSDTPKGAEASSLVYTMVEMAKANELNVYKYLTYLLEHRPNKSMSDQQLEELTPWNNEVKQSCQN